MKTKIKAVLMATVATLGLAAGAARAAGDITVRNHSLDVIHPYFKSNCWVDGFNGGNDGPNTWVFFGGIGGGNQFTWDQFNTLLDPACKHPVVRFTFTLDGEAAPTYASPKRTMTIQFDPAKNYNIDLGYPIQVLGAQRDDD